MRLDEQYWGSDDRFEGDRTLWLRSLPVNAQVIRAVVTLTPAVPTGGTLFEELIMFATAQGNFSQGDFGTTKVRETSFPDPIDHFLEVDFHARRTVVRLLGNDLTNVKLQIDLGGTYVDLNGRGSIKTPSDAAADFFILKQPRVNPLPGLTLNKFKLRDFTPPKKETDPPKPNSDVKQLMPDLMGVAIRTVPTNVSVRLGQMPAFWTRIGELSLAATAPDFTPILNAFLATATPENGFYAIPVIIHSDTLARLNVRLQIEYVVTKSGLPVTKSGSQLLEVTLGYNFSTLPIGNTLLTQVTLPEGAIPVPGQTTAQVRGEFKPSRVALGEVGEVAKLLPVLVSPQYSLAQPIQSNVEEIAVTGVDLLFDKTQPGLTGLNLSIQADADGKPSGEVLASAEVTVGKPLPPDDSSWGSATLPAPFRVLKGTRYWLVLQSQIGQAYWQAQTDAKVPVGLQRRSSEGLSWRQATPDLAAIANKLNVTSLPTARFSTQAAKEVGTPAPLMALFRLRNQPDRFTVPLHLQIGRGEAAMKLRLNEFDPLGRVEFQFDFSQKLVEYLQKAINVTVCGTENLLVNSDFRNPLVDDATLKLFKLLGQDQQQASRRGYYEGDSFEGNALQQDIDLQVERFIVLEVGRHRSIEGSNSIVNPIPQSDWESTHRPIRIDCAGKVPGRTTAEEIVEAINLAIGSPTVAFLSPENSAKGPKQWRLAAPEGKLLRLYLWCSTQVPIGWQGTPGRVLRLRVPGVDRIAMLLIDPDLLRTEQVELTCLPPIPSES